MLKFVCENIFGLDWTHIFTKTVLTGFGFHELDSEVKFLVRSGPMELGGDAAVQATISVVSSIVVKVHRTTDPLADPFFLS